MAGTDEIPDGQGPNLDSVARTKRTPNRKVIDGVEYFSAQAATEALGRSYRTLTRLERERVIRRPDPLPGQDPKGRWYSEQDLEELRGVAEQSGFAERAYEAKGRLRGLLNTMRDERPQRPLWNGEEVSGRPRQFSGRPVGDVNPFDWVPPGERRRLPEHQEEPLPKADLCPTCASERRTSEIVWWMETLPGGGSQQVPWCEVHGFVDLSEAEERDENLCPGCGTGDLFWELVEGSFQPVFERCGVVKVPAPAPARLPEEQPFMHQVNFSPIAPGGGAATSWADSG